MRLSEGNGKQGGRFIRTSTSKDYVVGRASVNFAVVEGSGRAQLGSRSQKGSFDRAEITRPVISHSQINVYRILIRLLEERALHRSL
jgi:hypothetical protein